MRRQLISVLVVFLIAAASSTSAEKPVHNIVSQVGQTSRISQNNLPSKDRREILLKNRRFIPSSKKDMPTAKMSGHVIIQFESDSDERTINELKENHVDLLQWIPRNAVMASLPPTSNIDNIQGIRWIGKLEPSDKLRKHLNRSLKNANF